jgi:chitinase
VNRLTAAVFPSTFAVLLACSAAASAATSATAPRFIYSPYKHLAHNSPYIVDGRRTVGPGALTWAFATGECGEEQWGDKSGQQIADTHVKSFEQAGVDYLVSTGGQGGVFTCATDEGMERFIARYESKHLVGIDFDIEAGQTKAQVESLVQRIKAAQAKRPHLRYSFTVATHAASDGSNKSLNKEGEAILEAVRRNGLRDYTFNLMVMDYGPGKRVNCVVNKAGVCDMGRSAIQAARNVHAKYKIPYGQIELTVMIGVNDVVSNVFTLDDARMLAAAVKTMKLAGLHYWSLDRDQPCTVPTSGASPTCSTLPIKALEYNRLLSQ